MPTAEATAATVSAEGPLVATDLVTDGGACTFRLFLTDEDGDVTTELVEHFARAGCLIEGWSRRLLGLSCGPDMEQTIADDLATRQERGELWYETGRT